MKMKYIAFGYLLILLFSSKTACPQGSSAGLIMQVLNDQVACWNEGDLECFMLGYWNSDSLTFIGKSGISRGWRNTLNNYKQRYPGKDVMGRLQFEIIRIESLHSSAALVTGKWKLFRESDNLEGFFSLIFKKKNGKWVIVYDHSTQS